MTNASGKIPYPTEATPLFWPYAYPRSVPPRDNNRAFRMKFSQDRNEILHRLERRGSRVFITSNLPLRRDGLPYADPPKIDDPGIAVWWIEKGKERVIACDRWHHISQNMRAINKTIEALAGLETWGASDVVERAFAGFTALPPGSSPEPAPPIDWQAEFAIELEKLSAAGLANAEILRMVELRFRARMMEQHPDKGGSTAIAADLNAAMAAAREQLG